MTGACGCSRDPRARTQGPAAHGTQRRAVAACEPATPQPGQPRGGEDPAPGPHGRLGGRCRPGGACTLHWAGQVKVTPHQPHALRVHELVGRQDLAQHPLAGAESLQNLSKTRTTCEGHGASGARLARAMPSTRHDPRPSSHTNPTPAPTLHQGRPGSLDGQGRLGPGKPHPLLSQWARSRHGG